MGGSTFEEMFKDRFPEEKKRVKTFQELLDHFKAWNIKKDTTQKQIKALAIEAKEIGITDTYQERTFGRNGKQQSRLFDLVTGRFAKREDTKNE